MLSFCLLNRPSESDPQYHDFFIELALKCFLFSRGSLFGMAEVLLGKGLSFEFGEVSPPPKLEALSELPSFYISLFHLFTLSKNLHTVFE